jgi:hypothetical protein
MNAMHCSVTIISEYHDNSTLLNVYSLAGCCALINNNYKFVLLNTIILLNSYKLVLRKNKHCAITITWVCPDGMVL